MIDPDFFQGPGSPVRARDMEVMEDASKLPLRSGPNRLRPAFSF
jgi:hypothetical protein